MKKGFTLIELLGVITLLGILAVIAVPIVDNSLSQNKEKVYETQKQQIVKGAEDYYTTHINELPKEDGDKKSIIIRDLQKAGNLELNIKDPRTNEPINQDETCVIVTKVQNNYQYKFSDNKTECEENK